MVDEDRRVRANQKYGSGSLCEGSNGHELTRRMGRLQCSLATSTHPGQIDFPDPLLIGTSDAIAFAGEKEYER
jgi:hypothetical protein